MRGFLASRVWLVCSAVVTIAIWVGVVRGVDRSLVLAPTSMRPDAGHAYSAPLPFVDFVFRVYSDTDRAPSGSTLRLFENDRQLGPAHSQHQHIREVGEGRFSHWSDSIYFSAADNSDPAQNGRTYRVTARATVPAWAGVATSLFTCGLLLLALRGRGASLDLRGHSRVVVRVLRSQARVYLAGAGVVIAIVWVGVLRGVDHTLLLSPAGITPETGHAYMARIPAVVHGIFSLRGDSTSAASRSELTLLENDRPLGPTRSLHQTIREVGGGSYSHWDEWIYFSASDNSHPARNGRAYRVVARAKLPLWAGVMISMVTCWLLLLVNRRRFPALSHPALGRAAFGILFLAIAGHLPELLASAASADAKLNHAIPIAAGDDATYQILAVNLRNGLGYSPERLLPIQHYRLEGGDEENAPGRFSTAAREFRRSPGLSLMLAGAYTLFGSDTIVAQRMMAVVTWMTAVLLLITGVLVAGWVGALAGGLSALYHLNYFPGTYNFERLLSENPTAFWVALFACCFTWFLKRASTLALVLSAVALAAVILMRVSFVAVLPMLLLFLILSKYSWRRVSLFAAVTMLPLMLWSAYASLAMGRPVLIVSAGQTLFANTNNVDTLEGVGSERWNRGGWNPGFAQKADGTFEIDWHHRLQPGESGWVRGLTFWRDNLSRLPELFYVKLRAGFWFANGASLNWLRPEGYFLIGIGYLLLAIGFLPVKMPWTFVSRFSPEWLLATQVVLLTALFFLWNQHDLWPVLTVWTVLLCLSLLRLSGRQQPLPVPNPVWLMAFVITHAITTVVFYGIRFHLPIDGVLMLVCFLGILLTLYETARRNLWLHVYFTGVVLVTLLVPLS